MSCLETHHEQTIKIRTQSFVQDLTRNIQTTHEIGKVNPKVNCLKRPPPGWKESSTIPVFILYFPDSLESGKNKDFVYRHREK